MLAHSLSSEIPNLNEPAPPIKHSVPLHIHVRRQRHRLKPLPPCTFLDLSEQRARNAAALKGSMHGHLGDVEVAFVLLGGAYETDGFDVIVSWCGNPEMVRGEEALKRCLG